MQIPTMRRAAGIALAATILPLASVASASSAEATTRRDGCAVTPLAPTRLSTAPVSVRYSVRITCLSAATVVVQQNRRELDAPASQDLGTTTLTVVFATDGSRIVSVVRPLPNTEAGNEEIYQRVRFRVLPTAVFTGWEGSPVVSMAN